MLFVYTYPRTKESGWFDVSDTLDTFTDTAISIFNHHKTATLWFGYLEGWMLTPHEEARLRKVIRTFPCHVVTREPLSFSQAWKNEIEMIYTTPPHGDSDIDHHGGSVHTGCEAEHDRTTGATTTN